MQRSAGPTAILLFLLAACGPSTDPPVGDMTDTSYYGLRGTVSRQNARGQMVAFEKFEGRFVWVDYAAPWCAPCAYQAREIRKLEDSFDDVVFLTVMTSDQGGYGDPATQSTAARWASKFGLDEDHVLAADLTAMTIPKHILFSPEGHVLFEKTGGMSSDQIQSRLASYKDDWHTWKTTAELADWMYETD